MARPNDSVYTTTISDSVSPTMAMASAPSRATQKMSTTTKMLSISISRTIGTASRKMERPMGPVV